MKKLLLYLLTAIAILWSACERNRDFNERVQIPEFNFPTTVIFEDSLSAYQIFKGSADELLPADGYHVLELSSSLFSDYAYKQRLVKIPAGTQMTSSDDGLFNFPNGTVLVKTFYYFNDERDTSLGKRIIESRLLIKETDTWNAATYVWNQQQTDAALKVDGMDTPISWTNSSGSTRSTTYHVPSQNECATCHQSNLSLTPIGPSFRNLNKAVTRNGASINQINHLKALNILSSHPTGETAQIVDYKNLNASLSDRARAYLSINCAHCHNPTGWDKSSERDFDFRYATPLNQTGITFEKNRIRRALVEGEMPFIGTTLLDEDGVSLVVEYLESL